MLSLLSYESSFRSEKGGKGLNGDPSALHRRQKKMSERRTRGRKEKSRVSFSTNDRKKRGEGDKQPLLDRSFLAEREKKKRDLRALPSTTEEY